MNRIFKRTIGFRALCLLTPCLFLCLQAGCQTNQGTDSNLQRLQGTWREVGTGDPSDERVTITVTGNTFLFHRDDNFWFETTIALPAGTDPQQFYATIQKSAEGQDSSHGKVVPAIFKIEDGILTVATFQSNEAEPPKSFEEEDTTIFKLRKVPSSTRMNLKRLTNRSG